MVVTGWLKTDGRPLGMTLGRGVIRVETYTDDSGRTVYYIVNLQPSGFVVVSADDLIEPIIGFADDGNFEPSPENPLGALVINDLKRRITAVKNSFGLQMENSGISQGKWRLFIDLAEASEDGFALMGRNSISDVRIEPLVKSKWGQLHTCGKNCYNYYTPKNYNCGCTATAMAQLMRYHEYPTARMAIGRRQAQIKVDDISKYVYTRGGDGNGGPYKWSLMTLVPDCSTTLEERQAIGALCYDASVAAQTEFSDTGAASNLQNAKNALLSNFKYSNAILASNSNGGIGGDWLNNMVNTNLDTGYPVILGITKNDAEVGHAVIADGYGYYFLTLYHHLNMGWSGSDDVWYNLPDVDHSGPDYYDIVNGCIYNIFTSGSGEIISGRVTDISGNPIRGVTVIAQEGRTPYAAVTNNKGIYALEQVKSYATYTVIPVKAGYNFTPRDVTTNKSGNSRNSSGNHWGIDFVGYDAPPPVPVASDYSTEDFETGDFSKFFWACSGNDSWTITPMEIYSGTYSAQAGRINNNESSSLQIRLDCTTGDIKFYRKISSELGCDYLKFYIDGAEKYKSSGTQDWVMLSFPVTAGTRTFKWTYSKDGSVSRGSDTAWIDDIVFPLDCGTLCDFDDNSQVNFIDFVILASQWLGRSTSHSADLNGDGWVDYKDLDIFAENWLVDSTRCSIKQ